MKYILLLFLLTSCSFLEPTSQPVARDKINYINNIQSCKVFLDHYECDTTDGNTYYVMRNEIDYKTTWDKSAWK